MIYVTRWSSHNEPTTTTATTTTITATTITTRTITTTTITTRTESSGTNIEKMSIMIFYILYKALV